MAGRLASSARDADRNLRPLHVPMRREELLIEARSMVEDLARWTLLGADEEGLGADEEGLGADEEGLGADEEGGTLECTRAGGLLRATSRITIRVDGPEGIPSAVLSVGSRSEGRGLSRDRANVVELVRPFERRVC